MNARAATCIFLILIALCIVPAAAANDERYGYITLESVQIQLHNDTAIVDMHYSVDEGTRIIFFLLGKQDLKNKLITILNYDGAQMQYVNLSDAEFVVDNASYSYGNGVYWFPTHQFNVVIPRLTITSPQVIRNYTNTNLFPEGMGYFENPPEDQPASSA
ncbi:conserved hypothetical protein [Methanoregula boonei 6A8]|jgi:hypothetical protein|uniref:Uncharacterized protein n=1 Tax=Methanoregula boonei (strain DSM 21154 / JCM 14090 / 6A8) TaxID=456442 RepID=A7I858_METB6|nr:hypothetical protein [Methanoregula boonei]ABS55919.1 conserved hypothetical protein [Methanoregula boonei 6A8]